MVEGCWDRDVAADFGVAVIVAAAVADFGATVIVVAAVANLGAAAASSSEKTSAMTSSAIELFEDCWIQKEKDHF